jgi:hypothetical protein
MSTRLDDLDAVLDIHALGMEPLEPYPGTEYRWLLRLACGHEQHVRYTTIRTHGRVPRCTSCPEQEARDLAAKLGWAVVEYIDAKRIRIRHPACGSEKATTLDSLRKQQRLLCDTCLEDEAAQEAERLGWAVVEFIDSQCVRVGHSACGTEKATALDNLRKQQRMPCATCSCAEAAQEAERLGWSLIEYIDSQCVRVGHSACGTEKATALDKLRRVTRLLCEECSRAEAAQEAERLGWEMVEYVDTNRIRVRHSACGTEKTAALSQLRKQQRLRCATCPPPTCPETGCERPVHARGLCKPHYKQTQRAAKKAAAAEEAAARAPHLIGESS